MKLRITTGRDLLALAPAPGLKTFHRTRSLVVEGSDDVVEIRRSERRAWLAGSVVALRTRQGGVDEVDADSAAVGDLLVSRPVDVTRDMLEGRYVALVVEADGVATVATDRFGRADLYYQEEGGQTILATSLDLLPVATSGDDFDQAALIHTLCVYGNRPPKRHTLYRGVRRLGVDDIVSLREGACEVREAVWQPASVASYGKRELDEYADILLEAIRVRGSRDGNVVYLSSGWDSTSILACLVTLFGARRVRAVIGRQQYAERSGVINQFEIDRARAVADYYGVRLDVVDFDYRKDTADLLERTRPLFRAHQYTSMTAVNHAVLAEAVARTTRGGEVLFAGEISDGAHNLGFSQFVTIFHPVLAFREYSDKMGSYLFGPTFLGLLDRGEFVNDLIYTLFRGRCGGALFDAPADAIADRRRQLLASLYLRSTRVPLWSFGNASLLSDAGRELYRAEVEEAYLGRAARELTPETLYAWYLHLYNSFHWQSSTVAPIFTTAEAHGLRMELPFWDGRLQDFLSAMPESWGRGLDLNPTKYPLKHMLERRIDYPLHLQVGPHSYLYDVDPTFSHSAELMYGSGFAPHFRAQLKRREYRGVLSSEAFDLQYVDAMVDRYLANVEVRGGELGDLLAVAMLSNVGWYAGR